MARFAALTFLLPLFATLMAQAADPWVVYEPGQGPGAAKHIVIVTGDDEYRSEESMPQMAKILSKHHGFKVTLLFAINPETGAIDPATLNNIPGLDALESADLMILFLRFRELPDEQMKHIIDYTNSGRPIIGIRTATHAFFYNKKKDSVYAKYSWNNREYEGGYGRQVLGETWVNHFGHHNVESTRGLVAAGMEQHPIAQGLEDIWGPSDVYGITELEGDAQPIIMGQVLTGMNPNDAPNPQKDLVPIAWTKTFTGDRGKASRVFMTTLGHSYDFKSEGVRRLLVNACYWALGMEEAIPPRVKVDYVGEYNPIDIGFGTHRVGVMPSEHGM